MWLAPPPRGTFLPDSSADTIWSQFSRPLTPGAPLNPAFSTCSRSAGPSGSRPPRLRLTLWAGCGPLCPGLCAPTLGPKQPVSAVVGVVFTKCKSGHDCSLPRIGGVPS